MTAGSFDYASRRGRDKQDDETRLRRPKGLAMTVGRPWLNLSLRVPTQVGA